MSNNANGTTGSGELYDLSALPDIDYGHIPAAVSELFVRVYNHVVSEMNENDYARNRRI